MGFQAEKWESGGWMLYRENQRLHHPLDGTGSRESCFYQHAPNYPLDLNACAEFEATFADDDVIAEKYWLALYDATEHTRWPYDATARQRCIAFLKTKGIIP